MTRAEKAKKIAEQISYMLDDSKLFLTVSEKGNVILDSENKKSFDDAVKKLIDNMGLKVKKKVFDDGEYYAVLGR